MNSAPKLPSLAERRALFARIKHGSSVTILTPHGQTRSGRAVMIGDYGWVLNMGGAHGTPGMASEENVMSVRAPRDDKAPKFDFRSNPSPVRIVSAYCDRPKCFKIASKVSERTGKTYCASCAPAGAISIADHNHALQLARRNPSSPMSDFIKKKTFDRVTKGSRVEFMASDGHKASGVIVGKRERTDKGFLVWLVSIDESSQLRPGGKTLLVNDYVGWPNIISVSRANPSPSATRTFRGVCACARPATMLDANGVGWCKTHAPAGSVSFSKARKSPSGDEFERVSLDGNMSPKTVEKLVNLLGERLPEKYPMSSHRNTDIARVMSKARIKPYSTDGYGRLMFSVPKAKMLKLIPALFLSGDEEGESLASTICYTLQIEVV